ncbi:MAG TPA: oligoendopeptidase F [Thermomicrobiales bacterium]|nr:oligoendopeptidase F [Thermomicrobiales bacterium]
MTESGTATSALPKRSELAPEQCWDIENVYATPEDWERSVSAFTDRLSGIERHQGLLGASGEALLAALRERDALILDVWRIELYGSMRVAEDATNAASLAMNDRAQAVIAQAMGAAAFIEPEILAIQPETLERYLAETEGLGVYAHYLDRLKRRRAHVRSSEVEQVLAQVGEPLASFYSIHTALADADLKLGRVTDERGNEVELGQGNLDAYIYNANRSIRQAAFETSADAYLALKNTFAANYAGAVKRDVFNARARGYESSLAAALSPEAIPLEVFHNLLDTVWRNLPVWRRYFSVRAKLLGIEKAHAWDITEAPLQRAGAPPQRRITFDEGVELIADSLAPLGAEYVSHVRQGIGDRWVDAQPNAGKSGGAFSTGAPGHHPFILMSWHDELGSVSTLIHELGHSMHSLYSWRTQPLVYADYSMFVAEVASNMNQALMGAHLLENEDDPDFLITVIEERMGNNLRYLFTMPILAKFELDCHERVERGDALTADGMIAMMADLYSAAYGDAVEIDRERMGVNWARFPHLFSGFYVFQYATGIAAAAQLAQQVRSEGEPAAGRYLEFLKTGGSRYPVDALRTAGIDMRQPAPIQAAFDMLAGYVARLEELTA